MEQLNKEHLLKISDIVFSDSAHSKGFKVQEIKDLLFEDDYWFLEKPNKNWYNKTIEYLESINYDISFLNINSTLI